MLFCCQTVRADGIDIVPWLLRMGPTNSLVLDIAIIPLLMVANYVLNFLVIGLPAARYGDKAIHSIAKGMIGFTLLAQLADRIGAIAGPLLGGLIFAAVGRDFAVGKGEGSWVIPLLLSNFIFSGIAVGYLAFYFLRKRWGVVMGNAWLIAIAAAILTNPAWALSMYWFAA